MNKKHVGYIGLGLVLLSILSFTGMAVGSSFHCEAAAVLLVPCVGAAGLAAVCGVIDQETIPGKLAYWIGAVIIVLILAALFAPA